MLTGTHKFITFFTQVLSRSDEAKQALSDIRQRHEELLKVEASLKELNTMFIDLAMIVHQQVAVSLMEKIADIN